jgi:hypothetical protein
MHSATLDPTMKQSPLRGLQNRRGPALRALSNPGSAETSWFTGSPYGRLILLLVNQK